MLTPSTSSLTDTMPSPPQSPTQRGGALVMVGSGVKVGVSATPVGVCGPVAVALAAAVAVCRGVLVGDNSLTVLVGVFGGPATRTTSSPPGPPRYVMLSVVLPT